MFLLYQCYSHLKSKELLDFISIVLFSDTLEDSIADIVKNPPGDPYDYTFAWENTKIFQNESDLIKKQFYYIFYKDELQDKLTEVDNIPISSRLIEEAGIFHF